jgi:hypothetical protein
MSDLVKITNRDNGVVGYRIPDLNLFRRFSPGETKEVPLSELKALQFTPGGESLLKNLFVIHSQEALVALNMSDVEPEYFYSVEDIKKLLLDGSLDQLEDALNFAPDGVINLIKDIAVKEEIPDMRKRDLITKKTGFGVQNAINVNHILEEENPEEEEAAPKRKAAPINAAPAEAPTRKATLPKYNVVVK